MNFPSFHLCFPWDLPFFHHLSTSSFWDSECPLAPPTPGSFWFYSSVFFRNFRLNSFQKKTAPLEHHSVPSAFLRFLNKQVLQTCSNFLRLKNKRLAVNFYDIIPTSYIDIKFREEGGLHFVYKCWGMKISGNYWLVNVLRYFSESIIWKILTKFTVNSIIQNIPGYPSFEIKNIIYLFRSTYIFMQIYKLKKYTTYNYLKIW